MICGQPGELQFFENNRSPTCSGRDTGGSATIKNYVKLAEAIFEVPCRVGVPDSIESVTSLVRSPHCSSVVGIARHGIAYRMAARSGRLEGRGLMAVGARKLGRAFHKYFF